MLQEKYIDYESAFIRLDLERLSERREQLVENFAKSSIESKKFHTFFKLRNTTHQMNLRKPDMYKTTRARTERLKNSSILAMQRLLNKQNRKL